MAGQVINPRWTLVRMHGVDFGPRPYERPGAKTPAGGRLELSLLSHHCPACGGALRDNDDLVAMPLGPGAARRARRAQRKDNWFEAPAVICHEKCVGLAPQLGAAMKVGAAADMLREAAQEVSERAKTHRVARDHDPTSNLETIVESIEGVSRDLSGWEEQLI